MISQRASGILLHPISLPGEYGIGTFGREAFAFVDFLVRAKQTYWQILPLGHTGYGNSPYQCYSSKAGNPLLIDLDLLVKEGLLKKNDVTPLGRAEAGKINYSAANDFKMPLLKKAFQNFKNNGNDILKASYNYFLEMHGSWLNEYAFFMALKNKFENKPWYEWEAGYKMANPNVLQNIYNEVNDEIDFYKFLQYEFFGQWLSVKEYANKNKISIIGDIPIYVSMDSVEAWANPELFQLDENKDPKAVGGVPPDYFSETGQLWGNPLFNWEGMVQNGFAWWIDRIKFSLTLYDVIRIDHFRGLVAYWAIPQGENTAVNGKWIDAPGLLLFETIKRNLLDISIIAEDLGVITPDVEKLRDSFNLPGMKILQFAFDSEESSDFLPHTYNKNCIVYTGTHDNEPVEGWFKKAKANDRIFALNYCHGKARTIHWDMIRTAWASVANTAIAAMQDLLGLGSDARMNLPGSTENNWEWRMKDDDANEILAEKLADLTQLYGRVNNNSVSGVND
jgi:4-alpha-glucanotransferase